MIFNFRRKFSGLCIIKQKAQIGEAIPSENTAAILTSTAKRFRLGESEL
jgi:hypothetical protein